MTDELLSLEANHTLELVPFPSESSVIGNKWVYSNKVNSYGVLDRYKAKLVKQEYDTDYEETLLGVAVVLNWPL